MRREDEDFQRPRMGRYDETEEQRFEHLFRFRWPRSLGAPSASGRKAPLLSDQALSVRTRMLTFNYGLKGREVVVKSVAGPPKTKASVRALVRYVARLKANGSRKPDCEVVQVFDGFGCEIPSEEVQAELDDWNLVPDRENLSKKARDALARGDAMGFRSLERRARYRNVQAWHFVWSIHADDDPDVNADRLKAATQVTVDLLFTERGHRCLWALHRDKEVEGRLHAHIVVAALSDGGQRIRCDKQGDYLYSMRVELAANLRSTGLDYIATRREDRYFLRQEILAGHKPLRENLTQGQIKSGGGDLAKRAPIWWRQFSEDVIANWANHNKRRKRIARAVASTMFVRALRDRGVARDRETVYQKYLSHFDALADIYEDPLDAGERWFSLACEGGFRDGNGDSQHPNRALASWYLMNKPETFGRLRHPGRNLRSDPSLKWLLSSAPLPQPREEHLLAELISEASLDIPSRPRRRIERDRLQVEASLARVADLAKNRGAPQKTVDDIRWRIRSELNNVQIGSKVEFPARHAKSVDEKPSSPAQSSRNLVGRNEPVDMARPKPARQVSAKRAHVRKQLGR